MTNGNGTWIKTLIGLIVAIIILGAIPALATMINNVDKIRAKEDQRIEDKFDSGISSIKEDISSIKIQQMKSTTILERIDRKM